MNDTLPPGKYIPIRLGTLRGGHPVNFDVFIHLGDHYTHYIRREDPFDNDRLQKLKKKGLKKLFITPESESSYLEYLDAGLNQITSDKLNLEQKADIANSKLVQIASKGVEIVATETSYRATEAQVSKIAEFLAADKAALRQILSSTDFAADDFQHAANVSMLSVGLASRLGMKRPQNLADLGLAALLHDIGKTNTGLTYGLDPGAFTPEQRKLYDEHPQRGADKVRDKPYVNPIVVELILNHEELGGGAGFPGKKNLAKLSDTQQILNLCNDYDRVCTIRKLSPTDAMKTFFLEKIGMFELVLIKELGESLKG